MPVPQADADASDVGRLPPAVRPYVIPRVARQHARVLVLQVGMFLGSAAAIVLATHAAGPSLVGFGVLLIILLASFASQDLYLAAIGADGLLLCRRGGERFFVAYTDLVDCDLLAEGGLTLVLRGGATVPVLDDPARNRKGLVTVSVQRQRILAARALCVETPLDPPQTHSLDRGTHALDNWIGLLHGLARPDGGAYRSNSLSSSVLWQIAEDGRVEALTRVAAVVALAPSLDAKGRARLQRLWSATANPYLQEAVAAAQDGRESALREVLDAVSRAEPRAQPSATGVRVTAGATDTTPPPTEAAAIESPAADADRSRV